MIYRENVAKHVKACVKDTSNARDLPCVLFLMSVRGNYSPSEVALDYVTFSLWERISSVQRSGPGRNENRFAAGEAKRLCVRTDLKNTRPGRRFFL